MLLNPAIMALVLVSAVVVLMLLMASTFAVQVLRHWDIESGSERQLALERRTYLISTLLGWVFISELVSLLLYIYNAESMSGQFVGAMCATGVLNVNEWGWPTLFLKIAVFFSGAIWLSLNRLDNQGYDYPLIRLKYWLLLLILPLVLAEFITQLRHFSDMDPDVITSCCGALFSADAEGVAAEVSSLQPATAMLGLYATAVATLGAGAWYALRGKGGGLFALFAIVALVMALTAIVSFIALYVYEHPHHHCPFCILKSGHGFAGYWLYIPLFIGTALALSAATLAPWGNIPSLRAAVARERPRLAWTSVIMFATFYLIGSWLVMRSSLTMEGVWW